MGKGGDVLGGSLTGDHGSLTLVPGAADAAPAADAPQGSTCCWGGCVCTGIPQGSTLDEADVLCGGGGCATGFPKSKSKRSLEGLLFELFAGLLNPSPSELKFKLNFIFRTK